MSRNMNFAAVALVSAGLAGTGGVFSADEPGVVTYVASVQCAAGACEVQRLTVPVVSIVREQYVGGICVEYTRQITGMKKIPSLDPATPIEDPQFENSPPRHACTKQGSGHGFPAIDSETARARAR